MTVAEHGAQGGIAPGVGRDRAGSSGSADFDDRPVGRRRDDRIVGASAATQRVVEQAATAARSDLPVLVSGPSGSGKTFVARAIHAWSARAVRPFVVVPCTALSSPLQAAELFGADGSSSAGPGAVAHADDGTLVLRDADRLDPALVRRLLQGSARRARIVFTSEGGANGSLFGDVPHLHIALTPLADRPEDILPLAAHFLAATAEEIGAKVVGFTGEARALLLAEPWTGNVRALRTRIRQAVRLAGDGAVGAESLLLAGEEAEIPSFKDAKRAFETRYVISLLRRCGGNISRAARLAKKDRKDFYDVIRRTGVDPTSFRA
jgi:two-component system response regulator GlrR